MYVLLNEENRIIMVTAMKQDEAQFEFDFPSDFVFSDIINWKIVDGELVYDELVIEIPEPPISLEEQIAQIEEALALTDETTIELYEVQLAQTEANNAQDEAIIELYELYNTL